LRIVARVSRGTRRTHEPRKTYTDTHRRTKPHTKEDSNQSTHIQEYSATRIRTPHARTHTHTHTLYTHTHTPSHTARVTRIRHQEPPYPATTQLTMNSQTIKSGGTRRRSSPDRTRHRLAEFPALAVTNCITVPRAVIARRRCRRAARRGRAASGGTRAQLAAQEERVRLVTRMRSPPAPAHPAAAPPNRLLRFLLDPFWLVRGAGVTSCLVRCRGRAGCGGGRRTRTPGHTVRCGVQEEGMESGAGRRQGVCLQNDGVSRCLPLGGGSACWAWIVAHKCGACGCACLKQGAGCVLVWVWVRV